MRFVNVLFLTVIFLSSCGIPSFEYVEGAILLNSSSTRSEFKIDVEQSKNINRFQLYARYYINSNESKKKEITDLALGDLTKDSEKYLFEKGFSMVKFTETIDSENQTYSEDILINTTKIFQLLYDSSSDESLKLYDVNVPDKSYFLYFVNQKNQNYSHLIGKYAVNENGHRFLEQFAKDNNLSDKNSLNSTIYIEFAVVNRGISSSLEALESIPVYITTLDIQI